MYLTLNDVFKPERKRLSLLCLISSWGASLSWFGAVMKIFVSSYIVMFCPSWLVNYYAYKSLSKHINIYWWLVGVTLVAGFGFFPQNFGNVLGTYECRLPFCEYRWGGSSTWRWWEHLNLTCCNQTCGTQHWWGQKPNFCPSHPSHHFHFSCLIMHSAVVETQKLLCLFVPLMNFCAFHTLHVRGRTLSSGWEKPSFVSLYPFVPFTPFM